VEKNFQEEILVFDNSQIHYYNLQRLLLEGKASHNIGLIRYSLEYLNKIRELEAEKIESLTRYFLENFDFMKKNIQEEINKRNKNITNDDLHYCAEWVNKSNTQKFGFWINNSDGKHKEQINTKFKQIPFQIEGFPKPYVLIPTIIRFYWNKNDIRYFLFIYFIFYFFKFHIFFLL